MTTVFFDLETGGLTDAHPDIQLAAVAVDENWAELASFERKIRFDETKADKAALDMNHYDRAVWESTSERETDVVLAFARWLAPFRGIQCVSKGGSPYLVARLAGHNAANFDSPRLRRMFERHKQFLAADPRVKDTLQLALWWCDREKVTPANFRLETLCKHFGIMIDAHDALGDVRGAAQLARRLHGDPA